MTTDQKSRLDKFVAYVAANPDCEIIIAHDLWDELTAYFHDKAGGEYIPGHFHNFLFNGFNIRSTPFLRNGEMIAIKPPLMLGTQNSAIDKDAAPGASGPTTG